MTDTHPNLEILGRLDSHDMAHSGELFAEDAVLGHRTVTLHVVVVWPIADGRIVEVWDILPARPLEVRDAAS